MFVLTASRIAALVGPAVASSSDRAAKSPQRLTLYSVATAEQYENYSDDRQRGSGNNPFGNYKAPTATTKATSRSDDAGSDSRWFAMWRRMTARALLPC